MPCRMVLVETPKYGGYRKNVIVYHFSSWCLVFPCGVLFFEPIFEGEQGALEEGEVWSSDKMGEAVRIGLRIFYVLVYAMRFTQLRGCKK